MRLTHEWLYRPSNVDLRFAQVDALNYIFGLVGWLSGFRAQTGSAAKATIDRRMGEAAAPREGSAVRAPT